MGCTHSTTNVSVIGKQGKLIRERRPSVTSGIRQKQHRSTINEYMVILNEKKRVRDIYSGFNDGDMLGTGNWGTVRVVTRKVDGKKFACKILRLSNHMSPHKLEELRTEITLLSQMDHPYIAKLYEVYEDRGLNLYLIMELLEGGELYTKLTKNSASGHYSEAEAVRAVRQMLSAVSYLHERGIVHRDLKLENFVYRDCDAHDQLVLIDFGLSRRYHHHESTTEDEEEAEFHDVVGSSYYIAPEVLEGSYGIECDMWSLGVIVFMLLSGRPPFGGADEAEIMKRALIGEYSMRHKVWQSVSLEAKDFVRKLLVKNPADRITAVEALKHPWVVKHDSEHAQVVLDDKILTNIRQYSKVNEFKRVALQAIAFSFGRDDLMDLERVFEEMDTDNDGFVSLEEFHEAMSSKGSYVDEEVDEMFFAMDADHVGKIHLNEFLAAAMNETRYSNEIDLLHAFERLDIHDNGTISVENLREIMGDGYTEEEISQFVRQFFADAHPELKGQEIKHVEINYNDFLKVMRRKKYATPATTPRATPRSAPKRDPNKPRFPDHPAILQPEPAKENSTRPTGIAQEA